MSTQSQPVTQAPPETDPRLAEVAKAYPRLKPFLSKVQIQQGQKTNPSDDRGLEFYPPWESENPNPGKITLELYDKMDGNALTSALGGDLLHYLGGVDPSTGKPVDPQYYAMKQEVLNARTPQQENVDKAMYAQAVHSGAEKRSYQNWLQQSRIDAYIRGYVAPEMGGRYPDEWRAHGWYNAPQMKVAVDAIKKYVTTESEPTPEGPSTQRLRQIQQQGKVAAQ